MSLFLVFFWMAMGVLIALGVQVLWQWRRRRGELRTQQEMARYQRRRWRGKAFEQAHDLSLHEVHAFLEQAEKREEQP